MKKMTLLAVLAFAMVAAPASAEVQNIKLSGSLNIIGLDRENFDFGAATSGDEEQALFITQTTVNLDADLTDQVSATIGLINERYWGQDTTDDTAVDLYLAYITLREFLYSPLTVVAGRQSFAYGNSFIVDSAGQNNVAPAASGLDGVAEDLTAQTTMDAVRFILDYDPLAIELLWAKINEGTAVASTNDDDDDQDLFGINTTYQFGDAMSTELEAYFFALIDKGPQSTTPTGFEIYTPGVRGSINVLDGLNLQGEVALQFGEAANGADIDALAAQFIATYLIPEDILGENLAAFSPVLQYAYTFTSGDDDPTGGDAEAWNPLFENQGGGTIYNTIFPNTNIQAHQVSLQVNPLEDLLSKVTWTGLWLTEDNAAIAAGVSAGGILTQPDGTGFAPATNAGESELGHEIDLDFVYDYTEDVQLGASFGWFMPGDFFAGSNDDNASQALVNARVNF